MPSILDGAPKSKGKGNQKSQLDPSAKTEHQKGSQQKKVEKGTGKALEGKLQSKPAVSPKTSPGPIANPPTAKPGGNSVTRADKRLPGRIKKQCVPYTLPSGCVNGNNCPFQHANDPATKKPLPPLQEDVDRYQAALKRNPSLPNPKPTSTTGAGKTSSAVPTIKR